MTVCLFVLISIGKIKSRTGKILWVKVEESMGCSQDHHFDVAHLVFEVSSLFVVDVWYTGEFNFQEYVAYKYRQQKDA